MPSTNHQFIEFDEQIKKRYVKTIPGLLTGNRLDPHRPENRLHWLLHTPANSFAYDRTETGVKARRIAFDYNAEVVELYSDTEVKLFERLNKAAIESGVLVEYTEASPGIDTTNVLTDEEILEVAKLKQTTAFNKRIDSFTSLHTLERIEKALDDLDRPASFGKIVREKKRELTGVNTK